MDKKHRRGDIRADGRVFWAYVDGREYWATNEKFSEYRSKQRKGYAKRQKTVQKIERKYKRGDIREDGKIFWRYMSGCKNGERWLNSYQYAVSQKKRASSRSRHKNHWQSTPLRKITHNTRILILKSIKKGGYSKKSKTFTILGCSYNDFMSHLESKFKKGMNWSNQGEWHLDHIIPISCARNEEEILKLNHYTNFQPLWASENLSKHNKHDPEELKQYLKSWNQKQKTESADLAGNTQEKQSQSKSNQRQQTLFDLCALEMV